MYRAWGRGGGAGKKVNVSLKGKPSKVHKRTEMVSL